MKTQQSKYPNVQTYLTTPTFITKEIYIPNMPNIQSNSKLQMTVGDFLKKYYYLTHNPLTSDPCKDVKEYVERIGEIERFKRDLDLISVSTPSSYLVIGDRGLGKTSFVNICMQKATKRGLKTVYIPNVPRSAGKFIKNLLIASLEIQTEESKKERMQKYYGDYIRAHAEKDPYRSFDIWTKAIDNLEPKPVIVVIDETDNLPNMPQIAPLFNSYIFSHAKDVIFFLCALPETYRKMHERMGAFTDRFPLVMDLAPFSKEELLLCLGKKLLPARVKKCEPYHPFDDSALEMLLENANGVPRYMLEIAREAIREGANTRQRKITKEIVERAAGRVQRSALDKTWLHLTYMEKETLVKTVEMGGDVTLADLAAALGKTKGTIVPYLNKLDANGIIERVGKKPSNIRYKVIVDAASVRRLARKG